MTWEVYEVHKAKQILSKSNMPVCLHKVTEGDKPAGLNPHIYKQDQQDQYGIRQK